MFRSKWVVSAALALVLGAACSDDDSGDGGASGDGGSGNAGSSGSGGGDGDAGSAGTSMSSAGSADSGGEEMYSAAEACERFAEVTCDKGAECGLVLPGPVLDCLTCNAFSLGIIASTCESRLDGPRNAADVDRCIDGIAVDSCEDSCSGAPFEDCEAFEDALAGAGNAPVNCDPSCMAP